MKTKNDSHTSSHYLLHQISELIEERGTMVVDYTSGIIANKEAYISPYSVIALCQQGAVESEYDMKSVKFQAHDIAVMRPGHVVKNIATSADYSTQLIVTSATCLDNMRQQFLSHHLATKNSFDAQPCQHLTNEQYRQVQDVFNLMRTVCNMKSIYRDELMSTAQLPDNQGHTSGRAGRGPARHKQPIIVAIQQRRHRTLPPFPPSELLCPHVPPVTQVFLYHYKTRDGHQCRRMDRPLCGIAGQRSIVSPTSPYHPANSRRTRLHRAGFLQSLL